MAQDFSQYVYKTPTGKYYSLVGGVAREFTDQQAAAQLAPNAQTLEYGVNTTGYDPKFGGGTTGGAWSTANFLNTAASLANTQLPSNQQTNAPAYTPPNLQIAGMDTPISQPSVAPASGQVQVSKAGVSMNIPADQLANWQNAGWTSSTGATVQQAPIYNPLTDPAVITPDSLKTSQGVTLPGLPADTSATAASMVTGAQTQLQNLIAQQTPAPTETDKKQQALLDQMTTMIGEQGKRAAEQLTQEQAAGLPALRQQFADINAQILSKSAEYNVLLTANQNKSVTMNSIIGNERAIINAKAADIGLLQAQALGLQGKITDAQNTVNRSIDLKYATIDAQLNTLQAQLNAIQPMLNKEEKIRAQAQQVLINQQKQAIADKKAEEKKNIDFVMDLMLKDPGAGITLTDSPQTAQIKYAKGKVYQQATRLAGGGGGGGGGITTAPISTGQGVEGKKEGDYWDDGKNIQVFTPSGIKTVAKSSSFWSAIDKGKTELQQGEHWGNVWKRIKNQFSEVPNEMIDSSLGVSWRKEGAFEEFKQKQYKQTQPAKFIQEAEIWKQLAENPQLNNETKKAWIMSQGFDPEDFNIY